MKLILLSFFMLTSVSANEILNKHHYVNKYKKSKQYRNAINYTSKRLSSGFSNGEGSVKLYYSNQKVCLLIAKELYTKGFVIEKKNCIIEDNNFWNSKGALTVSLVSIDDIALSD